MCRLAPLALYAPNASVMSSSDRNSRSVLHVNDCSQVASFLVEGLRSYGWDAALIEPHLRPFFGGARRRSLRENRLAYALERASLALTLRRRSPSPWLHIHYGMFGAIGLVSGAPYVLHFHGSDLLSDDSRWLFRKLHRLAAKRAAACLVSTPDLLRFESELGVPLSFLPNPVEPMTITRQRRADARVLFASKLDGNKRPELFLPAAARLASEGVAVSVLGFGSDQRPETQDLLARAGAAGATVIRDRVSQDAFGTLLAEADIVVGQFGVGALGMTELKALALGKVVVTHFTFGAAYAVPPPYVEASAESEILTAVRSLLPDYPRRTSIGCAAERWVQAHHGQLRVAAQLIEIYERAFL